MEVLKQPCQKKGFILSTDTTLDETEIIRLYGRRWDIEVFFKTNLQIGPEAVLGVSRTVV